MFFLPASHCILEEVGRPGFVLCKNIHELPYYIFQCLANIKNVNTRQPHHRLQLCFTHKLVFSSHDIFCMLTQWGVLMGSGMQECEVWAKLVLPHTTTAKCRMTQTHARKCAHAITGKINCHHQIFVFGWLQNARLNTKTLELIIFIYYPQFTLISNLNLSWTYCCGYPYPL
jgi:hypothetical protein